MFENESRPSRPESPHSSESLTPDARIEELGKILVEVKEILSNPLVQKNVPEIEERFMYLLDRGLSTLAPADPKRVAAGEPNFDIIDKMDPADEYAESAIPLSIYPAFPRDKEYGGPVKYYIDNVSGAAYAQESHTVILNTKANETPRFLACLLLHEFGHAHTALVEGRAGQKTKRSNEARLQEEVEMYTSEYRLMLAICGDKYRQAAFSFAEQIKESQKNHLEMPSFEGKGAVLDEYFGPALTVEAAKQRDYSFYYYCNFLAADSYLSNADQAKEYKTNVIRGVFSEKFKREDDFANGNEGLQK